MDSESLESSLEQYKNQLSQINNALEVTPKGEEHDSLTSLKSDLQQLIDLTTESLETVKGKENSGTISSSVDTNDPANGEDETSKRDLENNQNNTPLDDEYALFMAEMAKSGAYEKKGSPENGNDKDETLQDGKSVADTNIEEELSSLEGMKCSTMYSHKWGGAPTLHNAMVCSVIRDEDDNTNFYDIKVRVMFTNPTHTEMVPCPYYLDGECKFSDDQCRFSHGEIVHLSSLNEATEPNFTLLRPGCRVLAKLKQTNEATSSKVSEKYLLWHRAVVRSVDAAKLQCEVRLEHEAGLGSRGKEKNHHNLNFSEVFPLTDNSLDSDTDTESSLSDAECHPEDIPVASTSQQSAMADYSLLQDPGSVKLGDWEKYTKGIGSKLMQQMGYVVGTGLGPQGQGRLQPVPCRPSLPGRSLDHCMQLREHSNTEDPLKVEKKLRRLQKKQEERERKACERAKEKERHNVFSVLNNVLSGSSSSEAVNQNGNHEDSPFPSKKMKADKITDVKSSSCKNLNIEQFKISENIKRLERDVVKLKSSLTRNTQESNLHKSLTLQLALKSKEMEDLKKRQTNVTNEQSLRKDKKKITVF